MATPNLGYGTRGEVPIDAYNQWQRQQPWYQTLIKSFGQNPNNVHLTDNQKTQVIRAAQANGVVVDEGHNGQEVDDSGNFQAKSHALRNTLIVAGIAGAALLTAGAAGAFAAPAAGGTAAASGAAALGPSTAANLAATAGVVGGAGVPSGLAAAGGAGTLGSIAGLGKFVSNPAIASTLGGVFTNIYGANKAADAARYGVDAQTAAANHAADLNDEAAKRAETFSRQQAEVGWQGNEHTQKANYDQWAARQRAIATLGQSLGINYTLPDYAPGIDPHFTDAGSAAPAGAPVSPAGDAPAGINWSAPPDQLAASLSAYYKSKGVSDKEVPYWVSKAPQLVARGKELNDPGYADKRVAASEVFGGTAPTKTAPGTLASFVSPSFAALQPTTAAPTPYQPGTIGAYLRRA